MPDPVTAVEVAALRRACVLAARGLGATGVNPVVGAVILDPSGAEVGAGYHAGPGTPHAEVAALAAAGHLARGGTCVVSLEPCRHVGHSGACTTALLAAGIARVVYAVDDPTSAAAGGADVLRAAGVSVLGGVAAAEAERVNEVWLHAVRAGRPFVTWKYAASLDGRVAAADGTSRWVTGPEARADVHRLRAECNAVVVGVGTVLADDPALTSRDPDGSPRERQPLRVVLDSTGRTPPGARVLDDAAATLLVVAKGNPPPTGAADVLEVDRGDGGLALLPVLAELHRRHRYGVLLEGGPTLAGSFLRDGLVDRVVGYLAPLLIGGGGLPALTGAGAPTLAAATRLGLEDVTVIGPDVRLTARPIAAES
jgi:diaminohydroxyphosphoribosylaminopyrimidine deaminase/5-amino-6-(5-phosphoribosylamino)uracil reductase